MKSKEFLYWLQSAFDIFDTKDFNEKETAIVKDKLNSILDNNKEVDVFCNWLDGYFDLTNTAFINEDHTLIIKNRLQKEIKNLEEIKSQRAIDSFDSIHEFNRHQEQIGGSIRAKC